MADVDFNFFFTSHHHRDIFDGAATAILLKLHGDSGNSIENIPFQITNGAIGLPRITRPDLTRSKKDRPDGPFSVKFLRCPAGRPDYT